MTESLRKSCFSCHREIGSHETYIEFHASKTEPGRFQCELCHIRGKVEEFQRTGILTTDLTLHALSAQFYYGRGADREGWRTPLLTESEYPALIDASNRLDVKVKEFERDRWFNGGLQAFVRGQEARALIGDTALMEVRLLTMAGRCMITLEDKATKQSVSVITSEDEAPFARREHGSTSMGPMGIQGTHCTVEIGLSLLDQATKDWPTNVAGGKVGFAGVSIG